MEEYRAYFCPLDNINQNNLNFGHIVLKNGDNIIYKFEININSIYKEPEYSLEPVFRICEFNQIPLFNNFVKNLESSGEAKLSFRQYNGEKYYGVKDNIFSIYSKDNYSGNEKRKDYIVNESLINAFKEIETIIKSNLNFFLYNNDLGI